MRKVRRVRLVIVGRVVRQVNIKSCKTGKKVRHVGVVGQERQVRLVTVGPVIRQVKVIIIKRKTSKSGKTCSKTSKKGTFW